MYSDYLGTILWHLSSRFSLPLCLRCRRKEWILAEQKLRLLGKSKQVVVYFPLEGFREAGREPYHSEVSSRVISRFVFTAGHPNISKTKVIQTLHKDVQSNTQLIVNIQSSLGPKKFFQIKINNLQDRYQFLVLMLEYIIKKKCLRKHRKTALKSCS